MSGALDYIPGLIAAHRAGQASDHVHLGYWADGAALDWPAAQAAMTALHLDALTLRDGLTVVDVGCGIGGSLRMAEKRVRDAHLIGINIDPRQLAVCQDLRPQSGNRFDWHAACATALPLEDGSTDRVLSLEAMFHFPDRVAFLSEVARILSPGGLLVCSDIQFEAGANPIWLDVVQKEYAPWPDPVTSVKAVSDDARRCGLTLTRHMDLTLYIAPTWAHIVSSRARPETSAVAAMQALHAEGTLRYPLMVFERQG